MRKKYRDALLSHKRRLENVEGRVSRIDRRHDNEDRELREEAEVAALTIKQRKRYHEARKTEYEPNGRYISRHPYDHKTALLIAKECCAGT